MMGPGEGEKHKSTPCLCVYVYTYCSSLQRCSLTHVPLPANPQPQFSRRRSPSRSSSRQT